MLRSFDARTDCESSSGANTRMSSTLDSGDEKLRIEIWMVEGPLLGGQVK